MTSPAIQCEATREGLEARLGLRLAACLSERAVETPHDISERLRVARDQAVARARQVRKSAQTASPVVSVSASGTATLGGPQGWWLRLATWLPLLVLAGGLVLIEQWTAREQVLAAAEIDAVLLADDLPPSAWTDPGFREYLKSPPP